MTDVARPEGAAMPDATPSALPMSATPSTPTPAPQERGEEASPLRYRLLDVSLVVIRLGPVLILVGLIVVMSFLSPVFLTTGNIGNVLSQTAVIAVLAIGQLLVILTRGIDLSVGLEPRPGVGGRRPGLPPGPLRLRWSSWSCWPRGPPSGFVNGGVYVWGRLPHPFIITLATLSIARGLALRARRRPAQAGSASGRADVRGAAP